MLKYRKNIPLHTPTLGSFSFDVVKRILDALIESGSINKTNLALKTGLNYNSCLRYVNLLKQMGWIETVSGEVAITQLGRGIIPKLSPSSLQAAMAESSGGRRQTDKSVDESIQYHSRSNTIDHQGTKAAKKANIMLVDDEADVLLTYEAFLSSAGYGVEAFSDPQAALARFASVKPAHFDLVILDIRMPDVNGLQLYQRFKAMNRDVKIVFVSSLDAAKELASILPGIGPQNIIRKPVEKHLFIEIVASILG